MRTKSYRVYFTRTSKGQRGQAIAASLLSLGQAHGTNLPVVELEGEGFQIRDLARVGMVWKGVFARLRPDAPHIVNEAGVEREIELDDGDRVLDKCHFLYREQPNVLVWQYNRNAGSLSKMHLYLSAVMDDYIELPQVMNEAELDRVLAGQMYEISFGYDRPDSLSTHAPRWNQDAFDMMSDVHAAKAKFLLRAPRGGHLAPSARERVRQMLNAVGIGKVRVRLTDEANPIELFMAPLRDEIEVYLNGAYPSPDEVFRALEEAYSRQSRSIPGVRSA